MSLLQRMPPDGGLLADDRPASAMAASRRPSRYASGHEPRGHRSSQPVGQHRAGPRAHPAGTAARPLHVVPASHRAARAGPPAARRARRGPHLSPLRGSRHRRSECPRAAHHRGPHAAADGGHLRPPVAAHQHVDDRAGGTARAGHGGERLHAGAVAGGHPHRGHDGRERRAGRRRGRVLLRRAGAAHRGRHRRRRDHARPAWPSSRSTAWPLPSCATPSASAPCRAWPAGSAPAPTR